MGPGDSTDTSIQGELVSEHSSCRGGLFKVLRSVHWEGSIAAQIELDMRLLF